jgi:histidinol-phosphatase
MLSFDEDLVLAHNLADVARTITLGFFERNLRQWSKTDGSLATEADLAVEDALRDGVRAQRPTDAFLGEERGQTGSGSRRWIIDGIDGTVDFAARSPDWGTLIALEVDGRVVVSVCDQPAHRRRYWAVKGSGAYCRHGLEGAAVPLQASAAGHLAAARSYLPPPRWLPDAAAHRIAAALAAATRPTPHTDHPALQVACGGYDVAIFLIAGPWDIAAPALIVEEAGGRFSDLSGRRHLDSGNAVFTNGILHDEVLKVISAARG